MIFTLTKSQSREMNDEMIKWLTKNLKSDKSVFNILLNIRQMMNENPKYSWHTDWEKVLRKKHK